MSDDELRALAERLWGYGSDDGVAASAAILSLMKRATLAEARLSRAVEALRVIVRYPSTAAEVASHILSDIGGSE